MTCCSDTMEPMLRQAAPATALTSEENQIDLVQ